jgi:hypothetical protein
MIAAWSPFLILAPLLLVGLVWARGRAGRLARRRAAYIDAFDYARLLDRRLVQRRPLLSAEERQTVLAGLAQWFQVCRLAGRRPVSMPSQAVDEAWHQFILFTRNYQVFCREALGRFLHHVPAEAMPSATTATAGIRRTWRLACRLEGIDPRNPERLPQLFALDAILNLPDGFRYRLDCLAGGGPGGYCASHIGCGASCGSGCGTSSSQSEDGGGGDGGGCSSGCGGGGCGGD